MSSCASCKTTDALAAVHTGRADVAVVWRRAPESVDLPGQLLTELETGIVMQRDDPLAGRTTVDAHDLAGHRLVLFARDLSPGIYDDLLRALRPAGIQGAPVAVSHAVRPGQVAMIDAVATGGGFTSATSLAFDQLDRDDVMLVGFDPPFTAALELVWRDGATVATRALLSVAGRADVSSPTPGRTSQPDQPT